MLKKRPNKYLWSFFPSSTENEANPVCTDCCATKCSFAHFVAWLTQQNVHLHILLRNKMCKRDSIDSVTNCHVRWKRDWVFLMQQNVQNEHFVVNKMFKCTFCCQQNVHPVLAFGRDGFKIFYWVCLSTWTTFLQIEVYKNSRFVKIISLAT